MIRISTANAQFQQWEALLTNRSKRHRDALFLVQGVRPINIAIESGWPLEAVAFRSQPPLSRWASQILDTAAERGTRLASTDPKLLAILAGKDEQNEPELVAVARMPADDLDRIPAARDLLVIVFDRPSNPGNIGTLVRSADAFGVAGVIVTGHGADPYDPRAVRASTGSMLATPVVRCDGPGLVLSWIDVLRRGGVPVRIVGTDENGAADIADYDLRGPTLIVIGNETAGMSRAWREACDDVVRIPIGGSASSLNAAASGTVLLYEAARQRSPAR